MDQLISVFNEYTKTNPVIAGAISLWGLTVASFLMRKIPHNLYALLCRTFSLSITFRNENTGRSTETYIRFNQWFDKLGNKRIVNSYHLLTNDFYEDDNSKTYIISPGNGKHYFFYKRHFFSMYRSESEDVKDMQVMQTIRITMFGRNKKILEDLVEEFATKRNISARSVFIYRKHRLEWDYLAETNTRPISSVIIDPNIKCKILKDIQWFLSNKEWYISRGLPYKLCIILHGIPGTGKTSLIKAVATEFKRNIAIVNLNGLSDSDLSTSMSKVPLDSLTIIEDFDSLKSTKCRTLMSDKEIVSATASATVTLSGFLNVLDGVVHLDGNIIFMTTNVLDTIDSAVLRKGRIDHTYELKALTHFEIVEYLKLMFPDDYVPKSYIFKDIVGCNLQSLYFENKYNFHNFLESIPREQEKCLSLVNN